MTSSEKSVYADFMEHHRHILFVGYSDSLEISERKTRRVTQFESVRAKILCIKRPELDLM